MNRHGRLVESVAGDDASPGQQKSRPVGPALTCALLSHLRGEDLNLRPSGYETWEPRLVRSSQIKAVAPNRLSAWGFIYFGTLARCAARGQQFLNPWDFVGWLSRAAGWNSCVS